MDLEADKKLVVKAINRLRKEAGLGRITKLRRGVPRSTTACPVAMSIEGIERVPHRMEPDEWEATLRVMQAVDTGQCPELELPKSKIKIKYPGQRKATVIEPL